MQQILVYAPAAATCNSWALDPADGKLLVCIRVASGPHVHVALTVVRPSRRRHGHNEYGLSRVDGETWAIEPCVPDAHLPPPHPILPRLSLVLRGAPEAVSAALSRVVSA